MPSRIRYLLKRHLVGVMNFQLLKFVFIWFLNFPLTNGCIILRCCYAHTGAAHHFGSDQQ